MLPSDDIQQTTDILEEDTGMIEPDTGVLEPDTGVIERISRSPNHEEAHSERRQQLLQQKQTDMLPPLNGNASSSNGRVPWRQIALLREENQQLRRELETLRAQVSVTTAPLSSLNEDTDASDEIETIHKGYQQEIQQYQQHLANLMEERNQQQEEYHELESRYQDLYYNFLASVEEEAHRMVTEAARTITLSPTGNETHPLLQDVVQTLETHVRQLEDEHVAHTLYLLREAQRKAVRLEEELRRERQQLMEERQNLLNQQRSVREQARLRYQAIQTRLQARWLLRLVTTSVALLGLLLIVQMFGLSLLHVPLSRPLLLAVIVPIFLCPIIAYLFVYLRDITSFIYHGAPHKKKVKKLSEYHA
jgi:hypothetical protein